MTKVGIGNKAKEYKKVLEKSGYFTDEMKKLLSRHAFSSNIALLGAISAYVLMFLGFFLTLINTNNYGNAAPVLLVMGFLFSLAIALLFSALFSKPFAKQSKKALNDFNNIFFNNFLSKKLVIAHSASELDGYDYNKGEIINLEIKQPYSPNQYIHDLAIEAFMREAGGFILLEKSESLVRALPYNKKSGLVPLVKAQAVLINNVRKNASSSNSSDKTDIGYWYELLQKGAITDEEYNKKKQELL